MSNICPAVITAGIAITIFFNRTKIVSIFAVLHNHTALPGHSCTITGYSCREYTVKHINTMHNSLHQTIWSAYTHQIAWLVGRQLFYSVIQHFIHKLLWFSHTKTAYGITWEVQLYQFLGTLSSQFLEHSPLNYAKQSLMRTGHIFLTALGPAGSPLSRSLSIGKIRRIKNTFIKGHNNIRA